MHFRFTIGFARSILLSFFNEQSGVIACKNAGGTGAFLIYYRVCSQYFALLFNDQSSMIARKDAGGTNAF